MESQMAFIFVMDPVRSRGRVSNKRDNIILKDRDLLLNGMEENKENLAKNDNPRPGGASWWKPIALFYAKTTSWIIIPLILAFWGGQYVGKSFGSQSLFFVCVVFGFLITCFGIYREIKNYKKNLDK